MPPARPAWLDIDWRQHLSWHEVGGRSVNVLDAGPRDADPIVFIHGHSGCWQHWLEQIPEFMQTHRVVALDLPGFGWSKMPAQDITISGYAHTVDAVLDQLEISAACVVGNSLGGFVSAELAIQVPQRVERLVLVAAAGLAGKYIGLPTEFIRHPSAVALSRVIFGMAGVPEAHARRLASTPRGRRYALGFVARDAASLHPAIVFEYIRGSGRPAAAPSALALATYEFGDRVPEIACPTLIIVGDRDRIVPVSCSDEYERAIPDARKVVYERTGHLPMTENPERFNADVRAFLAEEPADERPAAAAA